MKKNLSLLGTTVIVLLIIACSPAKDTSGTSPENASSTKVTSNDGQGHYPVTVEVYNNARELVPFTFEKAPERTMVYGRNNVEIMLALGLGENISMIADCSSVLPEYTEAFEKIEQVRDHQDVGYFVKEFALTQSPDMVIGWYSLFNIDERMGDVDFWHERDIGTYTTKSSVISGGQSMDFEYQDIRNIAKIYNAEEKAEALILEIETAVQKGLEAAKGKSPQRVLILEQWQGVYDIFGEESVVADIARSLGAEPLGQKGMGDENIVVLNPDVIFAVHVGSVTPEEAIAIYTGNPALASVNAVKNSRIYPVAYGLAYAPGVRTRLTVDLFLEKLYGITP